MNTADKAFVLYHAEPLPFSYHSEQGKDITYPTADGNTAHAWEIKAPMASPYYLLVIHEWWGLNDYIKQESEKLANELGINVLALDLYDNKVAATREDAVKYVQGLQSQRGIAIVKGAYQYIGGQAKAFTLGWCFGGAWSLQAAITGGSQVAGCIMYYGQPEQDVSRLQLLQCDVLGFFGNKDKGIPPQAVDNFKVNMQKAGKKLTVYQYDAVHAFANPSNPQYDKTATADAHEKAIAFIKERMK